MRGIRSALRGADLLPVQTGVDQHAGTRFRDSGGFSNGPERRGGASVIFIRGGRIGRITLEKVK